MSGNNEIVSQKSADKTPSFERSCTKLRDDCDLATPNQKVNQPKTSANKNDLDFTTPPPNAAPTDKLADITNTPSSFPKTEEDYMKIAPVILRNALGLPKDASSKDFVDKVIANKVKDFEHAPKDSQIQFLDSLHLDKQTAAKILDHKHDSEKTLAGALLKAEKTFLDIPPTLKGEDLYKTIEKGIEHNEYQAAVDTQKILNEISKH